MLVTHDRMSRLREVAEDILEIEDLGCIRVIEKAAMNPTQSGADSGTESGVAVLDKASQEFTINSISHCEAMAYAEPV